MFGMWIIRWMTFGAVAFIISSIIRCIIMYKVFTTKGKVNEILEKDEHTKRSVRLAFGGGLLQCIVCVITDVLLWPLSVPIRIYTALQIKDKYLK